MANNIELKMPKNLDEFNRIMADFSQFEGVSQSNLLPLVEQRLTKDEMFFRDQSRIIDYAVREFRSLVC